MDPGAALAVVSLVFQVFGGCVKGFVLLSEAHNLGRDAAYLRTMLNLEEYRFTQWAKTVGLTGRMPASILDLTKRLRPSQWDSCYCFYPPTS